MEKLKNKLEKMIQKYGLKSKQAYEVSIKLDQKITNYYHCMDMLHLYEKSKMAYDQYNQTQPITIEQWNRIAKENGYLSSESMKYMGNIEFEQ